MKIAPWIVCFGVTSLLLGAGCAPASAPQNKADETLEEAIDSALPQPAAPEPSTVIPVPARFPKDIPLLEGGTVIGGGVTKHDEDWISFSTSMSVTEAADWYHKKLTTLGWQMLGTSFDGESLKSYSKFPRNIDVLVSPAKAGGQTTVTITTSIAS